MNYEKFEPSCSNIWKHLINSSFIFQHDINKLTSVSASCRSRSSVRSWATFTFTSADLQSFYSEKQRLWALSDRISTRVFRRLLGRHQEKTDWRISGLNPQITCRKSLPPAALSELYRVVWKKNEITGFFKVKICCGGLSSGVNAR